MQSDQEIRGKIAELKACIQEHHAQAGDTSAHTSDQRAAYIEAMYCSASLHALQWVVGDLDELLLSHGPRPAVS
jgi:hypothetical protein